MSARGPVKVEIAPRTGLVRIHVCTGSGCAMNGSLDVADAFERAIGEAGAKDVSVVRTGCHGLCQQGPVVLVQPDGVFYPEVTCETAAAIVDGLVAGLEPDPDLLYREPGSDVPVVHYKDVAFNARQSRIVLRRCGLIDPENIDEALAVGAYDGLKRVLAEMTPEQVADEVLASGLRGRGGAGFATGQKWKFGRGAPGPDKYFICNADEGDPGAFMDRSVCESDPHSVLEGMAIGAYAIGASEGIVYVRAEYPLAVKRLGIAIEQASARGFLGQDIFGSPFNFRVRIQEGAGAFVCGEETALMASVMGRRGMPAVRPPFPTDSGLWEKPTVINNVETLANVPWIILNGAEAYSSIGSGKSKGTKVFAVTGKVARSGLVEVPMGVTLRELVYDMAGGVPGGRAKAVQIGGPSGGCVPEELFDTPVEYEALAAVGAVVGSGGIVVVDDSTCMVDLARYFLRFTQDESCGKCVPCRVGTKRMLEMVDRIARGEGEEGDLERLESLAASIKSGSLCALGQTAPNPVLTTLRYFRDEYEQHISQHRCPAGSCTELTSYVIDEDMCTGCHACVRQCPVAAISGEAKSLHTIDPARCIACGACVEKCKFAAISVR